MLLALLLVPFARADTLTAKNKTKGPVKSLVTYFPSPRGTPPSPLTLLVVPLLGPAHELLPEGKLIVWAGRNDGTPLASVAVKVSVPNLAGKNSLVSAGQRVTEVTLTTNAQGLAEVYLAAPEVPPPNAGADGGNGGGEEGTGE